MIATSTLLYAARELFRLSARFQATRSCDEITAFRLAKRERADLYKVVSAATARERDRVFEEMRTFPTA